MVVAGSAISCFECYSLDGAMQECEDEFSPYNVTGRLYRRDCTVGHLGFEAFYCIKIKGVKSTHNDNSFHASCMPTEWTKLNGANAVSFVVVKHVLENFDNLEKMKLIIVHLRTLRSIKIKYFSLEGSTKSNDFLCSSILAVLRSDNFYSTQLYKT